MRLAFPGLMTALAEGEAIVTPSPLFTSVVIEQFNRAQLAQGKSSWERPAIHSLDAWMTTCWQQARYSSPSVPALLSLSQERELWRQAIEQDRPDLFDVRAMASIAQRAARVLAEYQIPTDGDFWTEHPDADRFRNWHVAIQKKLRAESWITRADLWRLLPAWLANGSIQTEKVTFAGLTTVSPGLKSVARALGDAVTLIGLTTEKVAAQATAQTFDSPAHEIEHVARRVRFLLETQQITSIGILVADLQSHQRDLSRILDEVLYPAGCSDAGTVHMQRGLLHSHPVIANALLLLETAQERIHHASAGAILRSPFVDGADRERSARAQADARLHRARELDFSLADLESAARACPIMQQVLRRIRFIRTKLHRTMRLPDWSAAFSDLLDAARWPAILDINVAEQRAVEQWSAALSELASLGLVSGPVTLEQALAHLRSILSRPGQSGDWNSPVQVLDASAAEGVEFDHTFVMNATDESWPPANPLSPLIPYKLQRLHQVPLSNPEALAEDRARKTEWLLKSAPQVELSYTGSLSPLLRGYVRVPSEAASALWGGATAAQSYPPVELDARDDSKAPALTQSDEVRGGSSIIKAQSLCPFRAFAEYRLNARGDDDACFGFDALERGNFVHKALEYVWKELQTQVKLKALSDSDLLALVRDCVAKAVHDDGSGPVRTLTTEAERERLENVLLDWLGVEKARPQPFTVEYVEEERHVEISGVKLRLRVDRIDRLRNGSLVLIDYKSGQQSREKLKGERPKEPQLLVYASAVEDPVEGVFFAELKNRNARAVGHGHGKHFQNSRAITDHKLGWDDFLDAGTTSVRDLATEFREGEASVNPQPGACSYCKVKPVCRIQSAGGGEEEEE